MNADRLLVAFNRLGDEPDTVQQFRKLVVGLSMSGKLIAPNEAALAPSNLLKQIEAKKRALVQQGLLRKQSSLSAVSLEDLPKGFTNPSNFVRLGEIARIEKGQTGIMKAEPGAYPLVVTAEERGTCDHFDFDGSAAIVPLVSSAGHGKASLQRLHYQEGKFALGSILAAIFPHAPELISARFLFEYLTSFKDELLVSQMIGTANVSLSVGKVSDVPVPLVPPLVQRKVDELMGLCDRVEAARAGRERSRDRLAAVSLARLNAPDPETFQDDARFALNALPALTTRPDQIKALRQTILNFAVRGKLVPQDPNDDPASSELRTVEKLKANQDIKKSKKIAPIGNAEQWCLTPKGWVWARWDQITDWITYGFTRPMEHVNEGVPIVTGKNVNEGQIIFETASLTPQQSFDVLNEKDKPQPGDILITKDGSIGRTAIVEAKHLPFCINQSVAVMWLRSCHFDRRFLKLVLDSPQTQEVLLEKTAGVAIKHISITDLGKMVFPLPPLAEQHRIVAKVDALMALCDRLEASLTATAATRRRLLDALLAEALAPVDARELEAAE